MRARDLAALVLLTLGSAAPLAASGFEVLAATGVLEPEGAQAGQELAAGARLQLEPWGRAVLRETGGCGLIHVVVGASDHRLAAADDCEAVGEPREVIGLIQQGAAFATRLRGSGSDGAEELVQMLVQEPCVFLARVSEQGSNARRCPSGYTLRGLRCSGEFCDHKDLLCCPYLGGEPDPTAKETASRVISEEFPNVVETKRFINGLACDGPYCDNLLPYQFKSSRLVNTRECDWTPWSSERPGEWLVCEAGRLVSGIRCRSDYCGDLALSCCQARVE